MHYVIQPRLLNIFNNIEYTVNKYLTSPRWLILDCKKYITSISSLYYQQNNVEYIK